VLALNLWQLAQVPVAPQQVEGVVDQPVLSARRQRCLQFGKVRTALVNDDYLSVDDGFAGDVQRGSDCGEALGLVQPAAGIDLLASLFEVHLDAVAVVFDFVKPLFALRRLGLQRRELGFNERFGYALAITQLTKKSARVSGHFCSFRGISKNQGT
jgi:hypothetical protein